MSFVKGLKCRECSRHYPKEPLFVCEFCFGPLEVDYDYEKIKKELTKRKIESRAANMWRYGELLPIDGKPTDGLNSGFTPLFRAKNLEKELGVRELYIKDDSVNHPTLSFKDRVVAVALSKAKEFGFNTVACASTGNLANSVAAQAAQANLRAFIFIPADLELGKIVGTLIYNPTLVAVEGNYDQVNRLCSEIATKYKWAFVNINIRPYYAEGSKTYGYEIVEQLGWRVPKHIIVPCAGGSLITKIWKSLNEFQRIGLIDPSTDGSASSPSLEPSRVKSRDSGSTLSKVERVEKVDTKIHAAQATGCCPIITAVKEHSDIIRPVKPNTIAKSLAIGNPADGVYAVGTVRDSGGWAEDVSDKEIVEAIKLLASTEGVFTETAGGVTLGVTKKLIEQGKIHKDESIVVCITGNGLKTQEAVREDIGKPIKIKPNITSFEENVRK